MMPLGSHRPRAALRGVFTLGTLVLAGRTLPAQIFEPQTSGTRASLRGLSVVSERVAWASGSGGTVIRTTDGGATWRADTIPGATRFDLRAIAAFDSLTAVVAATAGRVWRTENGGRSWTLVYENRDSAVFLDAVDFWDSRRGLVLGDPIDGRFLILQSDDGGRTWREAPRESRPVAQTGEAAFAASGSSLALHGSLHAWIGSGGSIARVHRTTDGGKSWTAATTPLTAPGQSAGIFSLAFADSLTGVAVGGDYTRPDATERNVALTRDGGKTWDAPSGAPPSGYRSAVAYVPGSGGRLVLTSGPNGVDRSEDGGRRWMRADSTGYHTLRFAPQAVAWGTAERGRVGRLTRDAAQRRP